MKKTYIAPQMEVITLQAESSILTASIGVDTNPDSVISDEADLLSTGKTGWDSESWNTED